MYCLKQSSNLSFWIQVLIKDKMEDCFNLILLFITGIGFAKTICLIEYKYKNVLLRSPSIARKRPYPINLLIQANQDSDSLVRHTIHWRLFWNQCITLHRRSNRSGRRNYRSSRCWNSISFNRRWRC